VVTEIGTEEAHRILVSNGRRLVERYWGRYVCFLHDSNDRSTRVLRDPTGGLPCLFTEWRGLRLLFSLLEDCSRLELGTQTINWEYVEAHVAASLLQCSATGLTEVTELQAGQCMTWRRDHDATFEFYWHPLRIMDEEAIEDASVAVERVRETTLACLRSWGATYPRVLHRLSGGLDSSIICAGLRATGGSGSTVECINYYTPDTDGDERRYARIVAKHSDCSLHEFEIQGRALRLEPLLSLASGPKPTSYVPTLLTESIEPELLRNLGINALSDGNGGDQLFSNGRFALTAYDYARQHGFGRQFLRIALHAARLCRRSLWSVLAGAAFEAIRRQGWDPLEDVGVDAQLASDSLIASARHDLAHVHPWLLDARSLPPGKFFHLQMLSYRTEFYNPLRPDESAEPIRPLMSQPLIELCLKIPTYIHCDGGVSRSIARRALAPLLPPEIATRSAKGRVMTFSSEVLDVNRTFVREVLLEGQLVKRGLLDRAKVLNVLSARPDQIKVDSAEIVDHACTELWLAACQRSPRAPQSHFAGAEPEPASPARCAS